MSDRPTATEKLDAADRFADALDAMKPHLSAALGVLRERTERGSNATPLFPFYGDKMKDGIDKVWDAIWALEKVVAQAEWDARRVVLREPGADPEPQP